MLLKEACKRVHRRKDEFGQPALEPRQVKSPKDPDRTGPAAARWRSPAHRGREKEAQTEPGQRRHGGARRHIGAGKNKPTYPDQTGPSARSGIHRNIGTGKNEPRVQRQPEYLSAR